MQSLHGFSKFCKEATFVFHLEELSLCSRYHLSFCSCSYACLNINLTPTLPPHKTRKKLKINRKLMSFCARSEISFLVTDRFVFPFAVFRSIYSQIQEKLNEHVIFFIELQRRWRMKRGFKQMVNQILKHPFQYLKLMLGKTSGMMISCNNSLQFGLRKLRKFPSSATRQGHPMTHWSSSIWLHLLLTIFVSVFSDFVRLDISHYIISVMVVVSWLSVVSLWHLIFVFLSETIILLHKYRKDEKILLTSTKSSI